MFEGYDDYFHSFSAFVINVLISCVISSLITHFPWLWKSLTDPIVTSLSPPTPTPGVRQCCHLDRSLTQAPLLGLLLWREILRSGGYNRITQDIIRAQGTPTERAWLPREAIFHGALEEDRDRISSGKDQAHSSCAVPH